MFQLLHAKRRRQRGDLPIIGWTEPHEYLYYRKTLRQSQSILILLVLIWLAAGLFSNNWLAILVVIITGVPLLIKQFQFFKALRHTFRFDFELDANLLYFILDNKLNDDTVFSYIEEKNELIIRVLKNNDLSEIAKIENLDKGLVALVGLPLTQKDISQQHVDYIFTLNAPKRLTINSTNQPEFTNDLTIDLGYGFVYNPLSDPHVLVAGGTGSGKSTFISIIILEIMKRKSELYICDPKNSDLGMLSHYLGDHVAVTSPQIAKVTRLVVEEMEQRYEYMSENFKYGSNFVDHKFKSVWLVFDEMGAFSATGTDKQSKEVLQQVMANIKQIILKGRQAGVFVLIAAQQMNANTLGGTELRDNLGLRLALGSNSSEGYRMVFGSHVPEVLPNTSEKGSGLIYLESSGKEQAQYYESPYVDMKNFNFIDELTKYQVAQEYDLGVLK